MEADRHSKRMTEYTLEIFRRFSVRPQRGLDLCCGTGTAIAGFSRDGYLMAGLDGSRAMLSVAKKKLASHSVPLYHQTLPSIHIPRARGSRNPAQFDFVTSFYDSLNYLLTQRDLKTAFRSIFRHITPGGLFIFDMNTLAALKQLWDGQVFAGTRDDLAWVWENEYIPALQKAKCHASFFVKKGKHWERFYECHTERAYANIVIKRLLREVGFRVLGFYRCHTFERPTKETFRICVVARKPD
jgi:SAM-dependent methyltransferase